MYYRVKDRLQSVPRDFHQFGYENEHDFTSALYRLHRRWAGWTGTEIGRRNGFMQLRFVGVYGDVSHVWLPDFMLERVPEPMSNTQESDSAEEMLDEIFGFD